MYVYIIYNTSLRHLEHSMESIEAAIHVHTMHLPPVLYGTYPTMSVLLPCNISPCLGVYSSQTAVSSRCHKVAIRFPQG